MKIQVNLSTGLLEFDDYGEFNRANIAWGGPFKYCVTPEEIADKDEWSRAFKRHPSPRAKKNLDSYVASLRKPEAIDLTHLLQNAKPMTKTETTALQVFEQVSKAAKANEANLRFIKSIDVGQGIRQGDVSLYRLAELPFPRDKAKPWEHGTQLAAGSTRGSRHVVAQNEAVSIFAPPAKAGALVGPVLEATERFLVEHPDHAHFSLPSGIYQTRYHQDLSKEQDRVHD